MSRGLGLMPRKVLQLIEADADGAWSVSCLCQHVYSVHDVESKHRVAVLGAVHRMKLPLEWVFQGYWYWQSGQRFLFNEFSEESPLRVHMLRDGYRTPEAIERNRQEWAADAKKAVEKAVYDRDHGIGRWYTGSRRSRRQHPRQGLFLEFHVGPQIDGGCFDAPVAIRDLAL
jgi:hypothetical protein